MSRTLWCELAWLGGDAPERGVLIELDDGLISVVRPDCAAPPAGAVRLDGLTLPGLANSHSHCFQRALRGRTEREYGGSFWSWRELMYALAERIADEAVYEALARATFAEMALAGFTLVGEFDYIHHSDACARAAAAAGVRLTLIDACYLEGGLPLFRDESASEWCERVGGLPEGEFVRPAAAIHSVRAVDLGAAAVVAAFADQHGWPLHAHLSEQIRENEECLETYGRTPTALLSEAGALSERFTAVHATHMSTADAELLQAASAFVCMCPTTERDLADGIGTVPGRLTVGTDSQSVIDPFEEARAVELDCRLATGLRGRFNGVTLARGLTANGYESLGWNGGGTIAEGGLADLTTVSLDTVRLAGTRDEHALDAAIFAGAAADVRHVLVAGEFVVRDGRHVRIDVAGELAEAIAAVS